MSASHLQTKAGPIHPNNINISHRDRAKVSVRVRCLVVVKTHGNNVRKLFIKIISGEDTWQQC